MVDAAGVTHQVPARCASEAFRCAIDRARCCARVRSLAVGALAKVRGTCCARSVVAWVALLAAVAIVCITGSARARTPICAVALVTFAAAVPIGIESCIAICTKIRPIARASCAYGWDAVSAVARVPCASRAVDVVPAITDLAQICLMPRTSRPGCGNAEPAATLVSKAKFPFKVVAVTARNAVRAPIRGALCTCSSSAIRTTANIC